MSVSLKPQTPVINSWLLNATRRLADVGIPSSRLDAELLLSYAIGKPRIYLHAHPEQEICSKLIKLADSYLKLRLNRIPIAYITGHKEFYGRDFTVTSATLIPRPESEEIIELLKKILGEQSTTTLELIDVGTGSGCLGITAKLEFPYLDVTLTDISPQALEVATLNARGLGAPVDTLRSDLLADFHQEVDIIVSNLPYIDKSWACSPETAYEPSLALFADDKGETIIKRLINESLYHLNDDGYLIIEADPRQHQSLIDYAKARSFIPIKKSGFILVFQYSIR